MDYRRFCVLYRSYRKYRSSSRTEPLVAISTLWTSELLFLNLALQVCEQFLLYHIYHHLYVSFCFDTLSSNYLIPRIYGCSIFNYILDKSSFYKTSFAGEWRSNHFHWPFCPMLFIQESDHRTTFWLFARVTLLVP